MKFTIQFGMVCGLFLGVISAAHAAAIGTSPGLFSPRTGDPGTQTFNFNSGTLPTPYSTGSNQTGKVVSGSVNGKYMQPYQDDTPYMTAAFSSPAGSQDLFLERSYGYFGLYWGSVDSYNTLQFFDGSTSLLAITGSEIGNMFEAVTVGEQGDAGSAYINISGIGGYNHVAFRTGEFAFESDNHTIADPVSITEPAAGFLFLLCLALAGGGFLRRHHQRW